VSQHAFGPAPSYLNYENSSNIRPTTHWRGYVIRDSASPQHQYKRARRAVFQSFPNARMSPPATIPGWENWRPERLFENPPLAQNFIL